MAKGQTSLPNPIPPTLDTPEFRAALDAYYAMRRAYRRVKWLPETEALNFRRWAKFPVAVVIAALEKSTEMAYQGVFPEKVRSPVNSELDEQQRRNLERLR